MAWWTGSLPRSLTGLLLIAHGALLTTVVAEPQVVSLPLYRNAHRSLAKRDTVTAALSNDYSDGMFWVNATVGTPGQPVQLQIDTGSSDIWMMGEYACIEISTGCIGGSYDELSSSTVSILEHGGFTIGYLDGSGVMGDYIRDDFAIGGVTVKGMTLAVATQVKDIGTGVMGIGFESDESIAAQGGQPYRNLVSHMVGQGLIKSRSYSLWLNDINAQTGNILFGGYDTAKFHGDLVAMKVQPDAQSGQITSMTVAWTSLAVNDPTHGTKVLTPKSFALPAVLDSGTTLTYVPQDLYDELASFANVVTDSSSRFDFVDCDAVNQYNGTLDFGFAGPNGPVISVLFSEMAIPVKDANGKQQKLENGSPACHFGLSPAPENEILLGDTFLRSAYVVYDLERKEIAIAKTNFNSDRSNIVEIAPKNSTATPTWKFVDSVTVVQTMTVVPGQPGQLGSLALASTHSYTQTDIGFHIPTATGKHNAAGSVRMVDSGILSSVVLGVFSALAGAGFLFVR